MYASARSQRLSRLARGLAAAAATNMFSPPPCVTARARVPRSRDSAAAERGEQLAQHPCVAPHQFPRAAQARDAAADGERARRGAACDGRGD
ncbi:hypothetical protein FGB62_33g172 [Gracilaria domingensis]|nr:hypothetical protein FGB62_33g172 [Gracilaria domingensis]